MNQVFRDKVDVNWNGPYRIRQFISDWIYRVETLDDNPISFLVHSQRLRSYSSKESNFQQFLQLSQAEETYSIESLEDIRFTKGNYQVLVHWMGFSDQERTWEYSAILYSDVPLLLREFLDKQRQGKKIWSDLTAAASA